MNPSPMGSFLYGKGVIKMKYIPESIIIHNPHSSLYIPEKYKRLFVISEEEINYELLHMTDLYTDDLFNIGGTKQVKGKVSRLICDYERFLCDDDEIMAERGMGVCYTSSSNLTPLKKVSPTHREEIINSYYLPHQDEVEMSVATALSKYHKAFIIDGHSFSSKPLIYEDDRSFFRPDICIGTDSYHTSSDALSYFISSFESLGFRVDINSPYRGTFVPLIYYKKDRRVESIMIEVNRSLYINEDTGEKKSDYDYIKRAIKNVVMGMSEN